jgi:peptide/nickel transport system permease protein
VKRFLKTRGGLASAAILLLIVLVAVFAPLLAPHSPTEQDLLFRLKPSSAEHWLGTDDLGRDLLSRLIFGSRISVLVAFGSVGIALAVAIPVGLFSGLMGGWVDTVLMRVVDGLLCFPAVLLALAISAVMGPGVLNVIIAVTAVYIPRLTRFVRGQAMAASKEVYVEAAEATGARTGRIMFRHLLPNVLPAVVVQASINLGNAVLIESSLTFVGAGVQPPDAGWGLIIKNGFGFIGSHPRLIVFPGLALSLMVLAANILGDAIRDAMDPRFRV